MKFRVRSLPERGHHIKRPFLAGGGTPGYTARCTVPLYRNTYLVCLASLNYDFLDVRLEVMATATVTGLAKEGSMDESTSQSTDESSLSIGLRERWRLGVSWENPTNAYI